MLRIRVSVEVRPTEDPSKVKAALLNVFTPERLDEVEESYGLRLIGHSSSLDSLEKLRELLRRERILDAAHRVIKAGMREGFLTFHLNKQAAYMGRVSFSDPGESPLGAITFEIWCDDARGMLNWLAPKTVGGQVREHERPKC